ncbi:MAG: BON domain-containing protein [Chloroflexi bacterium]|nr:BON domain-containing protein [Chloroflexota bacterium]
MPLAMNDQQIAAIVRAALRADARLAPLPVDVTVDRGIVTLRGEIPTPEARTLTVAVVQRTRGVRAVIDQLTVTPAAARPDPEITADVVAALIRDAALDLARIDVQTFDGVVYLRGTVPSPSTRQLVDAIARSIDGVYDVVADLVLEPPVVHPDSALQRLVRQRLDAVLQPAVAHRVRVAVHHGIAHLSGTVDSAALRWAIDDLARWTPGILDVIDAMQVAGQSS